MEKQCDHYAGIVTVELTGSKQTQFVKQIHHAVQVETWSRKVASN